MNYFDLDGFPVTNSGDGGDSAAQWGNLMAINPTAGLAKLATAYLGQETPLRHPDKNKWYGLEWRFSRDQLVAYLCGLIGMKRAGLAGLEVATLRLFKMHRRQWFLLAWNRYRNHVYPTLVEHMAKATPDVYWRPQPKFPDVTGPEVWALWLRLYLEGRPFFLLRPLIWLALNVLDLETLIGSVHWRFRKDRVTRNHLLTTIVSRASSPTVTSWLNFKISPTAELIERWSAHCEATGELNTAPLFRSVVETMGGWR